MSVSGISVSSLFDGSNSATIRSRSQQVRQDFQQLGQDLQSGNLPQAQTDFSALQRLLPSQQQGGTTTSQSTTQLSNPASQTIAQLGQDLKAGNLSAAQSDFSTLQQELQQQGTVSGHRHHHHHPGVSQSSGQQNGPATLFGELGQELQSGNLAAAQQTYSALQQDFLQFTGSNTSSSSVGASTSTSGNTSLNVSA